MIVYDTKDEVITFHKNRAMPLTIVVQAYGRLDKTEKCLANLLEYAPSTPFELILEDNGSEGNEVINFYKNIDYPHKYIVRIDKNVSSVHGLNSVIRFVDSKYLLLISNDIFVTPKAIDNLIKCADSDERIGMVNPVSTNITHGQQEDLGGFLDEKDMINKATMFNVSNNRLWEERMSLVPSAVLYRREVFSKIGLYDEDFIHDFGDDDISFRIRRAGYKLMLCRDSFVHHDHPQKEREGDYFYKRSNDGRQLFINKYNGLDAWEDTKSIYGILKKLHRQEIGAVKKVLFVEPRCGTSILDVRNYYRKQGILDVESYAFSTDARYYIDLRSITDKVIIDRFEFLHEYFSLQTFDMVVFCQVISNNEKYNSKKELLLTFLKKDGLFISVTDDIR